jgi:bifunctional polynucleotide phosphatase/kinase
LGIKFQVPEEFFQNHDPISYTLKGFCPFAFQKTTSSLKTNIDELLQPIFGSQPNMVMLIGLPGSGKSSIVENYFESKDYVSINQDTLKTKNKCVKVCEKNLEQGSSVIVDNTNTTKSSRATYLSIAKKLNVKCYAILINPDLDLSVHNGNVRSLLPNSDHAEVPKFVIKMQHDKYEAPTEAEGFEKIMQVPFIPKFQDEYHEQIWNSYTY